VSQPPDDSWGECKPVKGGRLTGGHQSRPAAATTFRRSTKGGFSSVRVLMM
jgi:hypothetical protein